VQGEHHKVMARTDERLASNLKLYKQRQMIVEHSFGTIKRTLGDTIRKRIRSNVAREWVHNRN